MVNYADTLAYNTPFSQNWNNTCSSFAPSFTSTFTPSFTPPAFTPQAFTPWSPSVYGWGGSSSDSESTNLNEDVYEFDRRRQKEINSKKNNTDTKTQVSSEINATTQETEALREDKKNRMTQENINSRSSFGASLGLGALFISGSIYKGVQVGKNKDITKMFFEYDSANKVAKYQQLYKDAPIVMQEAQDVMSKTHRQYLSALKKAQKKTLSVRALEDDYLKLAMKMEAALNTGDAQKVAEATERLRVANKVKYKKFFKKQAKRGGEFRPIKDVFATRANVSKVKAVKGNSFFRHIGGKLGIGMAIAFGGLGFFMEKDKIKEAKKYGSETYNKQILQSTSKALAPAVGYMAGDAIGKKLATKFLSKGVTKLAAKLATKGGGRLLGAAIGSIIPGAGTILGLALGTALDFALSHWVIPNVFGDNDAVDEKKLAVATKEELLEKAYLDYKNGAQISETTAAVLAKNPTFCAKIEEKMQTQTA